jgi:predicted HTH domain antitoxin
MKVTLNFPESLDFKLFDISMYVAAKLFEDGLLTSGQAAEMVGVSKRAFLEIIGKYGVSVFSKSMDELAKDIGNA